MACKLLVEAQHLPGVFERVDDLARQDRADRVELELEGGRDTKIPTSTPHAPEQIGVLTRGCPE